MPVHAAYVTDAKDVRLGMLEWDRCEVTWEGKEKGRIGSYI